MSGYDDPQWTALEALAWWCSGRRAWVDRMSHEHSPRVEVTLPGADDAAKGVRRVVQGTPRAASSLHLELMLARESTPANAQPVTGERLPGIDPSNWRPALPGAAEERFAATAAFPTVEAAISDVHRKLRDGSLVEITGRPGGRGSRERIPPLDLVDAVIDFDTNRLGRQGAHPDEQWHDLLIERSACLRLVPEAFAEEQAAPPPSVSTIVADYRKRLGKRPATKTEWEGLIAQIRKAGAGSELEKPDWIYEVAGPRVFAQHAILGAFALLNEGNRLTSMPDDPAFAVVCKYLNKKVGEDHYTVANYRKMRSLGKFS